MAVEKGRAIRPALRTGICGEHGGEPSSVKFCARIGMNYASCSPSAYLSHVLQPLKQPLKTKRKKKRR